MAGRIRGEIIRIVCNLGGHVEWRLLADDRRLESTYAAPSDPKLPIAFPGSGRSDAIPISAPSKYSGLRQPRERDHVVEVALVNISPSCMETGSSAERPFRN